MDIGPSSTGATAQTFDLLEDFRTAMGITANLPGMTALTIKMPTAFEVITASGADTFNGIVLGVIKWSILDPPDINPANNPHEDWLLYETVWLNNNIGEIKTCDCVDTIVSKSKRRMDEIQDTLWLVTGRPVGSTGTVRITSQVSTLLRLRT